MTSTLKPAWRFAILVAGALVVLFGPALLANEHPVFRDGGHWYAPLWQWARDCWAVGIVPLWDPLQNLGESHIADGTSSVFYPGKILFALPGGFSRLYTLFLAVHIAIAGATMYRLCRNWGCSPTAAMIGGLSYALSGSVFYQIYNAPFLIGAAWLPLALEATVEIVLTPGIKAARKFGVGMSLMLLGGDSQTAYHVLLILLALLLLSKRERQSTVPGSKSKSILFTVAGVVLALLLSAVQLFPSSGRVANSERADFEHARSVWEFAGGQARDSGWDGLLANTASGTHHHRVFEFSVGPWRLAELALPNVFGYLMPQHSRWLEALPGEGRTWTPSLYFGLIPLGCVVVAFANRRQLDRRVRWMLRVATFFLLAAMGVYGLGWLLREISSVAGGWDPPFGPAFGGLYWLMTVLLPGYVYFRYPAKLWVIVAAGLAVVAAAGWDRVYDSDHEQRNQNQPPSDSSEQTRRRLAVWFLRWAIVSVIALFVWFFLLPVILPDALANLTDRTFGPIQENLVRTVVLTSLASSAAVSFVAWFLLRGSRESKPAGNWRATGLLLLVMVDLVVAVRPHLVTGRLPNLEVKSSSVVSATPPIRKYRTAEMKQRPSGWATESSAKRMRQVVEWDATHLAPQYHHQLGTGLVNSRTSIDSRDWGTILSSASRLPSEQFGEFLNVVGVGDSNRAWLVHDIETMEVSADMNDVWFPDGSRGGLRDFRKQATLDGTSFMPTNFAPAKNTDSQPDAECQIVHYSPNAIEIKVRSPSAALLVLSETFDPGWRARVWTTTDTLPQPAEIVCVNGVMRGVWVDANIVSVRMHYLPTGLLIGVVLSLLAWSLVVIGWVRSRYNS